jgi:D-xylulose reductase
MCKLVNLREDLIMHILQSSYTFEQADEAFNTTRSGKSQDGKPSIKVIISGPGTSIDDK